MSYIAPNLSSAKRLQIAEITLSGAPALNGYFTFSTLDNHNFDSAPTGFNSTSLVLPGGSYMFRACLDITRSDTSQNYQFQFEANTNLIGKIGQTGNYLNTRSDVGEAVYESLGFSTLRLKVIGLEHSSPTLTTDSKLFIWRVKS
tara:strand:- start:739 stop:1173 length:435 start_codon:yes stop_codon:yes gene_type:complete